MLPQLHLCLLANARDMDEGLLEHGSGRIALGLPHRKVERKGSTIVINFITTVKKYMAIVM